MDVETIIDEWDDLRERGNPPSLQQFLRQRLPDAGDDVRGEIQRKIEAAEAMDDILKKDVDPYAETLVQDSETTPRGPVSFEAGTEVVPGHRLVSRLGAGGFGEVWKATAPGGFHVALKFVRMDGAGRAAELELRALEIAKRIRHPNILSTFGTWQRDGWLIIAAELAGQNLHERLQKLLGEGKTGIRRRELLAYMQDAAKGIDFLNKRKHLTPDGEKHPIQHRDIKPQNLLLSGGSVKIADLGIAKHVQHSVTGHTGSLTLAYAPPEAFNNETTDSYDQYSLAVTYCVLRGGRRPFAGTDMEIVRGHLSGTPDLSMLPEDERPTVARALSKSASERWPSCSAFVTAIEGHSGVIPATPPPLSDNQPTSAMRQNLLFAAVAVLVAVVGVAAWYVGSRSRSADADGPPLLTRKSKTPPPERPGVKSASRKPAKKTAPPKPPKVAKKKPSVPILPPVVAKKPKQRTKQKTENMPQLVPGIWAIRYYPSNGRRTYVIGADGSVKLANRGKTSVGQITRADGSLLLLFGDNSIERLTFAGNYLYVEHFNPVERYRDGRSPSEIAAGNLVAGTPKSPFPPGSAVDFLTSNRWGWKKRTNLGSNVNTKWNEIHPSVSEDGLELFFSSDRPTLGKFKWNLWTCKRSHIRQPWGKARKLFRDGDNSGNSAYLSSDGLTLYLESSRQGGVGGQDIWMSKRESRDSLWGTPVNLGRPVNTEGKEEGPVISPDGLFLYFTSIRRGGMGNVDIWAARRRTTRSPWEAPVNLMQLNSREFDTIRSISADGLALITMSQLPVGDKRPILWIATRKKGSNRFSRRVPFSQFDAPQTSSGAVFANGRQMIVQSNGGKKRRWDLYQVSPVEKRRTR